MAFDGHGKYQREAREAVPAGYGLVFDGELLPDDLIWSWPTKEWLRADSPEWGPHKVSIKDCVAVCRTGRLKPAGHGSLRNYSVKRGPEPTPATAKEVPAEPEWIAGQTSLFK